MPKGLWDIHCHILPGVDDGAETIQQSLELLKAEAAQGVTRIVLTPHYRPGMFDTNLRQIQNSCIALYKAVLRARKTQAWAAEIRLFLGCEFHSGMDMIDVLNSGLMPTMADTKCILIEFSFTDEFAYIYERCNALIRNGYRPIIAHAERYQCLLTRNYEELEQLVNSGAYVQMNAASVLGKAGSKIGHWCVKAIEKGLVHFIASDAHNLDDRPPYMLECYAFVKKKFGSEVAANLFARNAMKCFGRVKVERS